MSKKGMPRIIGLSPDDMFFLHDADEIPKEEVVMFLKMYKGYPQPIRDKVQNSKALLSPQWHFKSHFVIKTHEVLYKLT